MTTVTGLLAQGAVFDPRMILIILGFFGIMYFLMIRPQQRRQKKWQEMLRQIKPGDKVVTSGGLSGVIMSVKDDAVVLRVPPDNVKLEVVRSSIVTLTTSESAKT